MNLICTLTDGSSQIPIKEPQRLYANNYGGPVVEVLNSFWAVIQSFLSPVFTRHSSMPNPGDTELNKIGEA